MKTKHCNHLWQYKAINISRRNWKDLISGKNYFTPFNLCQLFCQIWEMAMDFWHTIIWLKNSMYTKGEMNLKIKKGMKGIFVYMMHINALSVWEKVPSNHFTQFHQQLIYRIGIWQIPKTHVLSSKYMYYNMMDLVWPIVPTLWPLWPQMIFVTKKHIQCWV